MVSSAEEVISEVIFSLTNGSPSPDPDHNQLNTTQNDVTAASAAFVSHLTKRRGNVEVKVIENAKNKASVFKELIDLVKEK